MTEYDNTNRGAIWGNEDRREGKNDPHYKGSLNVNGVDYWVSAWKRKEGASPKSPSLSFKIEPKDKQQPTRSLGNKGKPANPQSFADDDMGGDSVPF